MKAEKKARVMYTVTFFQAHTIWFWRARHRNGNVVADGAEGYHRIGDARRALSNFLKAAKAGTVEIQGARTKKKGRKA